MREMGISFKLSKVGKRYYPKPNFKPEEEDQSKEGSEESAHVLCGAELGREVRDYRKCFSGQGSTVSAANATPIVQKIRLRMSLENVIKDISLIADNSWTYSDLMEVEARVVKALNSHLYLNPTRKLERVWKDPTVIKLNLGIRRKKRPLQTSEVTISSNNQNPEKIFSDRIPESSHCGLGETGSQIRNALLQQAYETMPFNIYQVEFSQ